jgi:AraC-like DNA-binding protein
VRQAVELIHAHPEHPWTTASLARRVAVSARSLQEGFARSHGVPPSVYLRSVRLDRAHADLQAADPHTTTVAHVAGRWGFLYLSRFAAAYRTRFGEARRRPCAARRAAGPRESHQALRFPRRPPPASTPYMEVLAQKRLGIPNAARPRLRGEAGTWPRTVWHGRPR